MLLSRLLLLAMLPASAVAAPGPQRIEPASLCRVATEALFAARASLPSRTLLDAHCEPWGQTIEMPAGPLELRPQVAATELLDGLHAVTMQLRVSQQVPRVVHVPVRLALQAPQWCAREGVASRQEVSAQHFEPCLRPLRRAEQWRLAGQPLPAGRLKRALRGGDVLTLADVAEPGQQLRGDAVTVRYQTGALMLESRGELVQDARIGDAVRVRVRDAAQSLTGRLAAAGLVDVETQP